MDDNSAGWFVLLDLFANVPSLFVYIGVYLLVSFASLSLFRKVRVAEWKAWVPVVREWEMFKLAGMSPWWSIILPAISLVLATVGSFAMFFTIIAAIQRGISGTPGEGIAFGLTAVFVFFAVILLWAVFTLVIMILMMNRVGRGFGQSGWLTLLGVVCYPAWVAVLGWGSAEWFDTSRAAREGLLRFPNGSEVVLRSNRVVLGSSTTKDGLPAGTQLVTMYDPAGTVAPFHAQLDRIGVAWQLSDLGTHTGTYVVDANEQSFRISQPVIAASKLMLGQVRVDVVA